MLSLSLAVCARTDLCPTVKEVFYWSSPHGTSLALLNAIDALIYEEKARIDADSRLCMTLFYGL
jgi:hypothetical protein